MGTFTATYSRPLRVGQGEGDCNNRMKLSALMRALQQTAGEHIEEWGLPADRLFAENMVFLLTKVNLRIHRMPLCNETVTVSTAPVKIKGVRYLREIAVDAQDGARLVSALTVWVLADPRDHRILRPSSWPYEMPLLDGSILSGAVGDIPLPGLVEEKEPARDSRTIRYSHLDVNRHVNNAVYGDFVLDALPFDALVAQGLELVAIHFQHEATLGETVEVLTHHLAGPDYLIQGTHGDRACFAAFVRLGG